MKIIKDLHGRMPRKNPLYTHLPSSVAMAINSTSVDLSSNAVSVEDKVETFLRSAVQAPPESFTKYMSKSFFLRNVLEKTPQMPRKKDSYLSLTERRKLGLYKLSRTGLKYQDFVPLHNLWKEYMSSYLNVDFLKANGFTGSPLDKQWDQFSRQLVKADFHGAKIEVTRSKCSSLVGKTGIIVFDTKNTYKIIGEDNVVRTIPKEQSVFEIPLDVYKLTVFGKHLCVRPAERSVKKIKIHMTADL